MIKSMILIGFWMFVIPIILGLGILKLDKKGNKNVCLALILGLFAELLVFSCLAIPMTFLRCSFTLLKNLWTIMMIILSIVSIIFNRKNIKDIVKQNVDEVKGLPKILTAIFLILLVLQCYYPFKYMHEDYDDSNFVAKATIARDTDALFKYNDAGYEYEDFPTRQVFSQFPHYTATIAVLSDTHPAVLARTIFPVVFIIIAYSFFYVFGMSLFKKDQTKALVFLNILAVVYIFGDYSRYTNFVRLLYRTWQGKSLVANLTIPFIWYVFIEYIGKENSKFGWIVLGLCLSSSITFSSMAFILPPMMVVILLFLYAIKDKKKKYIIALGILFVIAIIGVSLYLTLDNLIVKNETLHNEELTFIDKFKIFIEEVKSEENLNLVKESYDRAGGGKHYFALFTIAILLVILNDKNGNKDILYVFAIYSIVIMIINLNPVFSKLWSWTLGSDVHWRIYWLLPIGYLLAYVLTECVFIPENKLKQILVFTISIIVVVLNGKYVFTKLNYAEVDNYYKVPDHLLEMIFTIMEDDEVYKKIAGPEEVIVYSRQIIGNAYVPHERYSTADYWSESVLRLLETKDEEGILKAVLRDECNYLIINKNNTQIILNENEIKKMCENNTYILFKIILD